MTELIAESLITLDKPNGGGADKAEINARVAFIGVLAAIPPFSSRKITSAANDWGTLVRIVKRQSI